MVRIADGGLIAKSKTVSGKVLQQHRRALGGDPQRVGNICRRTVARRRRYGFARFARSRGAAAARDRQGHQCSAKRRRKRTEIKGSRGQTGRSSQHRSRTHAALRAQSGFTINQLTAEYRALRASVLHLWTKACEPSAIDPRDVVRFNEAIDQALAESVAFFSAEIENERNLFLGMLGHDMRSPLQVIQLTSTYLSKLDAGADVATHRLVAGSEGSMGLGLYIAREIAIAHHGDISHKSDENETVFTVRLPRLSAKSHP
jgi:signal transduction histidine kinase